MNRRELKVWRADPHTWPDVPPAGYPGDYVVIVRIPAAAGPVVQRSIVDAVADAAHESEPDDRRGWDIDVSGYLLDPPDPDQHIRTMIRGEIDSALSDLADAADEQRGLK